MTDDDRRSVLAGADLDQLASLAVVGARTPSFNHDIASKIQGLLMSIDEISELSAGSSELREAARTAHEVVLELNRLLQENRALTKPPVSSPTDLAVLIQTAARRVALTLRGQPPAAISVDVPRPLALQGLAIVLDFAGGLDRRRSIELAFELEIEPEIDSAIAPDVENGWVEIGAPLATELEPAPETKLALAAWIFARVGGEMRRFPDRLAIRLPLAKA